jgi:hypothetical protein
MDINISDDEEYFLSQVLSNLESKQPLTEVPQVWRPTHFDVNRFQAAYYKFCLAVIPEFNVEHAAYYQSIQFTEAQAASISSWICWFRDRSKSSTSKAAVSASIKSDREAQNRYNDAIKKKLEDFRLQRQRKMQEKDVAITPTEDNWGRLTKPKIEDDGNSWREQM